MKRERVFLVIIAVFVILLLNVKSWAAEYSMKSGEISREGLSASRAQAYFAKRVDEITKAKVKVNVFYGGTIGSERNCCEQLQLGSLDFAKVMPTNATAFVPMFGVFGMPYLIRSIDQYYKIPDSPAGKIIQDEANKAGFVILAYWDTGLENIYNSRRPIAKPEDLKGLKIRTRETPILIDTVNAMGASGAPLATPEVFTALQTKVFDGGVQSSVGYAIVFGYAEICKYYSLTEHALEGALFMASKKRFDKLPKEIQDAIRQAGGESMEYMHRQVTPAEDKQALDIMNKQGVKINEVDKAVFMKRVAPVQAKYRSQFRADLIDGIANLMK